MPHLSRLSVGPAVRAFTVMAWVSVVLVLDSDGSLGLQGLLGLATWALLALALWAEPLAVRVQTGVVVVFASAVEYTFAPLLGAYTYRFDNVPAYVPPGHGLVYLSAYALGHAAWVQRHRRTSVAAVLVVGGAWALHGLLADRSDVLGAFWYACLVLFVVLGPSRGVYLGAFVAVSWLELAGTHLGTWTWGTHDPTGWVSIGNPPSGAAGGYGWFDLVALLAAPAMLRGWARITGSPGPRPEPEAVDVR